MTPEAKKTTLRMIPYGIYVLTAADGKGKVAAATVNWVTQTAFSPPLVVVGVKTDSGAYALIKETKTFVLNMLGKDQKGLAFTFFRPADVADGKISGQAYRTGTTGAPILIEAPAALECKVTAIVAYTVSVMPKASGMALGMVRAGSRTSSPRVAMRAYPAKAKNNSPAACSTPLMLPPVRVIRSAWPATATVTTTPASIASTPATITRVSNADFWIPR